MAAAWEVHVGSLGSQEVCFCSCLYPVCLYNVNTFIPLCNQCTISPDIPVLIYNLSPLFHISVYWLTQYCFWILGWFSIGLSCFPCPVLAQLPITFVPKIEKDFSTSLKQHTLHCCHLNLNFISNWEKCFSL